MVSSCKLALLACSSLFLSGVAISPSIAQVIALSCSNSEQEVQLVLDFNKKEGYEYFSSGKIKSTVYKIQEYPDFLLMASGSKSTEFMHLWSVDRFSLDAEYEKSSKLVPVTKIKVRCSRVPLGEILNGKERKI